MKLHCKEDLYIVMQDLYLKSIDNSRPKSWRKMYIRLYNDVKKMYQNA